MTLPDFHRFALQHTARLHALSVDAFREQYDPADLAPDERSEGGHYSRRAKRLVVEIAEALGTMKAAHVASADYRTVHRWRMRQGGPVARQGSTWKLKRT